MAVLISLTGRQWERFQSCAHPNKDMLIWERGYQLWIAPTPSHLDWACVLWGRQWVPKYSKHLLFAPITLLLVCLRFILTMTSGKVLTLSVVRRWRDKGQSCLFRVAASGHSGLQVPGAYWEAPILLCPVHFTVAFPPGGWTKRVHQERNSQHGKAWGCDGSGSSQTGIGQICKWLR